MTDPRAARRIAVVTVGRSDFSILRPLVQLLRATPGFDAGFWVGGAHFDPAGGMTLRDIEASGLPVWARVQAQSFGHTPAGTAAAMADQLRGFGAAAEGATAEGGAGPRPDLVLILGDRFEAVAAGLALVPFGIPVGHLSGGSITEGAIDDVFRHALSKLAALHFCDLPEFARRIQQMGEEPARIFTVGALGLDGVRAAPPRDFAALRDQFAFDGLQPGYVLATLHPETRSPALTRPMAEAMVAALAASGRQVIYTYPNADPGADQIIEVLQGAAAAHPGQFLVRNFGFAWFYTAMAHAGLVLGNSSSGIYEAASFGLAVVDIGDRQKNRFHGANVLHCGPTQPEIAACLAQATAPGMAALLAGFHNPYGDGRAAQRILRVLQDLDWAYLASPKRFVALDPDFIGMQVELP